MSDSRATDSAVDRAGVDWAALDAGYVDFATAEHAPGLVAGVITTSGGANGALAHMLCHGVTTPGGDAVTPTTRFRIASMTKNITGLTLLALRDRGLLRLDDPAADYVPELAGMALPTTDSAPPTVRDFLTHQAGNVSDDPWGDRQLGLAEDDFTAMLRRGWPAARPPGVAFEYSNLGYAVLGRVIANVTAGSYQQCVTDLLLRPLGMADTGFDAADGVVQGHSWFTDRLALEPPEPDGAFAAMGGLITTAADYARYLAFVLDAWPARDDPDTGPVRRSTVRELASAHGVPQEHAYGYGFRIGVHSDLGLVLAHAGGLPGYGSHVMLLPDRGLAAFGFANITYAQPRAANLSCLRSLVGAGLGRTTTVEISPRLAEVVTALEQAYGTGTSAALTGLAAPNLFADSPVSERDRELAVLRERFGAQLSTTVVAEHALAATVTLVCDHGNTSVAVALTPTPELQLQRLDLLDA